MRNNKEIKVNDAIDDLRINFDRFVELNEFLAKLMRKKFDALRKEGFTDAQAIELCRK